MFGAIDAARLGVCLQNQMGKTVSVDLGLADRLEDEGDREFFAFWTRKVTTSEDLEDFFVHFEMLAGLLVEQDTFMFFEGFEVEDLNQEDVHISLNWGS